MSYNIKQRAVSETATFDLNDADGEPLLNDEGKRLSLTLYGPGSRVYEEAEAERQNKVLEISMARGGKVKLSAEDRRQLDATFHARVTKSFNEFDYEGGGQTFEAFKAAYLDGSIGFIGDQAKSKLGDWGNFKKPSQTSSDSTSASVPG